MRNRELTVLKLGGSVLRDRDALAQAVHEVYRWWRAGSDVVAVVSALEGETDKLLTEARSISDEPSEEHCATLLATGELRSAALLGLALQRAGLRASVLTPHQLNLRVTGSGLDAEPAGLDTMRIKRELESCGVVVIPGFIGIGDDGDLRTLGRGGSDLSAIALAHALGATRCRLVKDVAGLFSRDPKLPGPPAKLLTHITFEDALKLDGGIVQHKAVRFARDLGYTFEVGGLHAESATLVGASRSVIASAIAADSFSSPTATDRPPLRVALLGLGTVGLGVYRRLAALPHLFKVTTAVCRNTSRAASQGVDPSILRSGIGSPAAREGVASFDLLDDCNVLIEAIGGIEPAGAIVEAALARGIHVVTANKSLVAARRESLLATAAESGAQLRFAAAVGGAAPVIEAARQIAGDVEGIGIARIDGVLNGTVNFILNSVAAGLSFDAALADAQRRGLAEADPTRDLSGTDAADKLAVLCSVLTNGKHSVDTALIPRDDLSQCTIARLVTARQAGAVIRQVASLDFTGAAPRAEVALRAIAPDHPLANLPGALNAALLTARDGTTHLIRAEGAGRWPTTESVLADCLDLTRAARRTAVPAADVGIGVGVHDPQLALAVAK